jgi:hypothetical protein
MKRFIREALDLVADLIQPARVEIDEGNPGAVNSQGGRHPVPDPLRSAWVSSRKAPSRSTLSIYTSCPDRL